MYRHVRNLLVVVLIGLALPVMLGWPGRIGFLVNTKIHLADRALSTTDTWLLHECPYLQNWPTNLPHDHRMETVVFSGRDYDSPEVMAESTYRVVFREKDVVLVAKCKIALNCLGRPVGIKEQSLHAWYATPGFGDTNSPSGDRILRQSGSDTSRFNCYYGTTVSMANVTQYLALLRETGDVPDIREALKLQPKETEGVEKSLDNLPRLLMQQ